MPVTQRTPSALVDAATTTTPSVGNGRSSMSPTSPAPRTHSSATLFSVCGAAFTLVVLIVFMLQNTRNVEVSFLRMHGILPLALALLIVGVGVAVLVMLVGAARITQLRRLSRQHAERYSR